MLTPLNLPAKEPIGYEFLLGQIGSDEFMKRRFTSWNGVRLWLNQHVSPNDCVLFVGEQHRLWFHSRVLSSGPISEPFFWRATRESWTAQDLRKRIREAGIAHVLYNFVSGEYRSTLWGPGPAWTIRQLHLYDAFMSSYAEPTYTSPYIDNLNGGFCVFSVRAHPIHDGKAWFLPSTEGRFAEAVGLSSIGRHQDALRLANQAASPIRGCFNVQSRLATYELFAGHRERAFAILRLGVESGFINEMNLSMYAALAIERGSVGMAIRPLARSCQLRPDLSGLRGLLGWAFFLRGEKRFHAGHLARARQDLDQALFLIPSSPTIADDIALTADHLVTRAAVFDRARAILRMTSWNADYSTILATMQELSQSRGSEPKHTVAR